jgi:hypothetical protein
MGRLALERAIHEWGARWLLCYSGEGDFDGQDCGCCIGWEENPRCGCQCHERINELDRLFSVALGFYNDMMHSWMAGRHVTGRKS